MSNRQTNAQSPFCFSKVLLYCIFLFMFMISGVHATLYYPENYGAVPNDEIDDTAAIQAALNAANAAGSGNTVRFSTGTYLLQPGHYGLTGALKYFSNTTIEGEGINNTVVKSAGALTNASGQIIFAQQTKLP